MIIIACLKWGSGFRTTTIQNQIPDSSVQNSNGWAIQDPAQFINGVVTLASFPEGSEVHFLVKGVFSPISPCLGNICHRFLQHFMPNQP